MKKKVIDEIVSIISLKLMKHSCWAVNKKEVFQPFLKNKLKNSVYRYLP